MKIPGKYSHLLFNCLLSMIMVTIITFTVVLVNQGLTMDLPYQWAKNFLTAWPVACPTLLILAPRVRKVVAGLT